MKSAKSIAVFLFRGLIFFNKLRRRDSDIFFELSAEKVDVGKITKLRNLRNSISFQTEQVAGVV